jgi:hypothetical protein
MESREYWEPLAPLSGEEVGRRLGIDGGSARKRIRKARREYPTLDWYGESTLDVPTALIRLLAKGCTESEIVAKGFNLADARKVAGYDLFETRNHDRELVYLLLPHVQKVALKPKVWTYRWAKDTDGSHQPYLMIQMPATKWEKVKLVPLADVHFGSSASMVEKFREYVNYIAMNDNVFGFIGGDLFENSHGDSNHGVSIYEQEIRPKSQVEQMVEILSPIAHKLLWAIPGNHEDRSRTRDYDPIERLCEMLDIPYSYEPIFVDLLWKGHVFSFHDQHGKCGGQTQGGKMNAAARPQEMQEHVMFTIMAHVHDGNVSRNSRICRDRVNFRLEFRKQYIIICPSFFKYFGSYASKEGYKPGSYGSISLDLFPNGQYHANA